MAQYVPGWASGLWDAIQGVVGVLTSSVSMGNSTFSPLAANAVYTGSWEDITKFVDIRVSVFADQASATDGLQMQVSPDAINADGSDAYTIPASTNKVFGIGGASKYFRIVYTNGAVAQTAFRLTTKYNVNTSKASSVRMQDARSLQNDFEEVASYNSVLNGTSWDMQRGIVNATNSIGTGIAAAGLVGQFDDVSPTAITENQFGNVRIASDRSLLVKQNNTYAHIAAGQATTVVKNSPGVLHSITFNSAATATNTTNVYDNASGSGTVIATIAATAVTEPITLHYDVAFPIGLTIITATANGGDMTVSYT